MTHNTDNVLTLEMLDAAIAKMKEPITRPWVSLASVDMLALRLASDFELGVANGTIDAKDMESWAKKKMAEAFGGDE